MRRDDAPATSTFLATVDEDDGIAEVHGDLRLRLETLEVLGYTGSGE